MPLRVRACIFDMDGLLLDTETLYTVAQQRILDRFGKTFTWELKAKMMGRTALAAAQILIDELQLHGQMTAEQFVKEREEILDELFATSPLLPGVERLIRHLSTSGVPIAVATASHRRHFELKTLQHQELFGLFRVIITGDQVKVGKPAPDIFLMACEHLGCVSSASEGEASSSVALQPTDCLVFEDAPNGVEAGLAAGMQVVMVPDANLDRKLCSRATCVVDSLLDFKPEQWGLPAFTS
mmetsp:Transcript_14483/g.31463  ORF Transcript_14483/g.31463 Transcript_14483/m.31463 type:complete len:240 (+) Transcript_14483:61-780(+)|eukprot:CAMPEP_0202918082 /NCGR_PEP_ID=MMETSP1392-20130828/72615_1 /ASSEMBLY_ACC=CAM_ASM_000868 /TAXON_ID=225041 /ORGANISM="Chlamydomonas chlamydogama, Strain SAG 11-48b" /LENGTH=239 /DNA_ID=CAMNT_0049611033 /DNA_START=26 /DNA_END=745 /DNA_ORIENTATION=+